MNRLLYIVFFTLLLPAKESIAQQKSGNVAVHSDPRLALLLNRTKSRENDESAAAEKTEPVKNLKEKVSRPEAKKSSIASVTKTSPHTEVKEGKYLYNPNEDEVVLTEKPVKNKKGDKAQLAVKDDVQARAAYKKLREEEKEDVSKNKSTDEEIRAYRETIEKERGTASVSKKVGRTGIAADEVRYLNATVSGTSRGGRYNGTGFRVQIYYGTSREEAMRRKAEFMRHYPGVPTYFTYASPTYKVKVGDYRRREDAISMFREANGTYSPCMIVPDVVAIH